MKHWVQTGRRSMELRRISPSVFKRDYVKAEPHRPRWAQKKTGRRVRLYVEREEVPWVRCSVSCKTRAARSGVATDIDGTATVQGDYEDCVRALMRAFKKSCRWPMPKKGKNNDYWEKDAETGFWFILPNSAMDEEHRRVRMETVKRGDRVCREGVVQSCR